MKDYQTISVQIPRDAFEMVRKLAKREYRSINQQINLFIAQKLEEKEKKAEKV